MRLFWLAAFLALAICGIFAPVLDNGYVWDDGTNVVHNRHLDGSWPEVAGWAFTRFRLGHYQPLTWLSHALDRRLWGPGPAGAHGVSLLLHLVNVLLVGWLAQRLVRAGGLLDGGGARIAGLVAAALWAIHPLRVESVAWITQRRDLLSTLFALAATLAYAKAFSTRRFAWWSATGLLFALSLFSKALAITLPLAWLVLDRAVFRRRERWPRLLLEKLPFFALSAAFGVVALFAQRATGALRTAEAYGLGERLAQAGYAFSFYPRALFAGAWSPLYEMPAELDPSAPRFILAGLAVVAATVLLAFGSRRLPLFRPLLTAWGIYLILVLPVSGVAQSGAQIVADRYSYLSTVGFFIVLGAGVAVALRTRWRVAVLAAVVLAFVALGVLSHRQTQVWRNDVTLWSHVLDQGPSAMASNNLAAIAVGEGRFDDAVELSAQAIEHAPKWGAPWRNAWQAAETPAALDRSQLVRLERALAAAIVHHDSGNAWHLLGLVRLRLGTLETARVAFETALEVRPDHHLAWRRLGETLVALGRAGDARVAFDRALALKPGDPATLAARRAALGSR